MSAMPERAGPSVLPLPLPRGRPFVVSDLEAMPDDGHRYELIDGTLIVSPAPTWLHQRVVFRLARLLDDTQPSDDFEVVVAPFDVKLADDTAVEPDVLVARYADMSNRWLERAPLLAVEVLSPSSRLIDGAYVEVGNVRGNEKFHAELPYPVDVRPRALVERRRT